MQNADGAVYWRRRGQAVTTFAVRIQRLPRFSPRGVLSLQLPRAVSFSDVIHKRRPLRAGLVVQICQITHKLLA